MGLFDKIKSAIGKKEDRLPVVFQVKPKVKVYGTHGRLEIPELSISVPLYKTTDGNGQTLCDNKDSAAFMRWPTQNAIADHSSQANFSNLNKVRVGKTIATIDLKDKKENYCCVSSQVGHIRILQSGNRIFDNNWVPCYWQNKGGLCIYTCIGKSSLDVMDIRLTYWQPVSD